MQPTKKYIYALCFLALLQRVAAIREIADNLLANCVGPPPDGTWSMTTYVKLQGSGGPETATGRFVVRMVREPESNGYTGTGAGLSLIEIAGMPAGQFSNFDVLAVFNPATCTMAASLTNPDVNAQDSSSWIYDGNTLGGPAVNAMQGSITPLPVRQELEFLSE